jgi:hypothetical protein
MLTSAASNPDAVVRYYASEMVLYVHSDASYLSKPKARSRVGGFFYLGNKNEPTNNPCPNGPIHIESKIMKTPCLQQQKPKLEPSSSTDKNAPTYATSSKN